MKFTLLNKRDGFVPLSQCYCHGEIVTEFADPQRIFVRLLLRAANAVFKAEIGHPVRHICNI